MCIDEYSTLTGGNNGRALLYNGLRIFGERSFMPNWDRGNLKRYDTMMSYLTSEIQSVNI